MDQTSRKPLIIAHRGSSTAAPENTIAAFSRAVKDGSEGIEFDVRLTRDRIPVVFHDSRLKRMADNEARLDTLNLNELADVDVGEWFRRNNPESANADFSGERIPTLEKVLNFLSDFRCPVYVELKSTGQDTRRLSEAAGEVLREFAGNMNLIVKSFDFETIPIVKSICPQIEIAALFAPNIMLLLRKEKRLVGIANKINANRLSVHFSLATKKLMKAAGTDLPVTVWTVDTPRWIKKGLALGIDSIITNEPLVQLAERNKLLSNH